MKSLVPVLVHAVLLSAALPASADEPAPATQPAASGASGASAAPASETTDNAGSVTAAVGTPTPPGADTPQAAASEPAKKPPTRPLEGSSVFAQTSMSTATVFQGQQQYSNPTVDSSIIMGPRYTINDAWQLRGRLIFSYEWTNGDDTVKKNEPRFSDTTVQLFYRKIPEVLKFKTSVGAGLGLPTSPESRARTLIVNPSLSFIASRPFTHVAGGDVQLILNGGFSHPFYRSTTSELATPAPYAFSCVGGSTCQDQLSGTLNPANSVTYSALLAGEWGKWSPALFYLGASSWAYSPKDAVNPVDGTALLGPTDGPATVRQNSYFSAWLDYNFSSWVTGEVGYYLSRSLLDANGQYANPLFDRYQDTRVYLGASFQIDNILQQMEGIQGEAGVVRTKNHKAPFRWF